VDDYRRDSATDGSAADLMIPFSFFVLGVFAFSFYGDRPFALLPLSLLLSCFIPWED
jgi:hypothetical protein